MKLPQLLSVLCLLAVFGHGALLAVPPNIVLVLSDDQGWGDVGYNGNRKAKTPHLDRMAEEGLRLNRFYAAPFCMPTRNWTLTGRAPRRYGYQIQNPEHTLPALLKRSGYRTGHFGKWHLGNFRKSYPERRPDVWDRGSVSLARRYLSMKLPPWEVGFERCVSAQTNFSTWRFHEIPEHWHDLEPFGMNRYPWARSFATGPEHWIESGVEGSTDLYVMDQALDFMADSIEEGAPFLAVVWFSAPHRPIVASPEHREPFSEMSVAEQHYYGCVYALDQAVGKLRSKLREWEVADNTLLWFSSDNGPRGHHPQHSPHCFGSTGGLRGQKGSLWEGGVRVPALVEWPKRMPRPRTTDYAACVGDIFPTALEAAGLTVPAELALDGESLLPLFDGIAAERAVPIAIEGTRADLVTLVGQRYKLISNQGMSEPELYDLESDPRETRDLSQAEPDVYKRMIRQREMWMGSVDAELRRVERQRTGDGIANPE